MLEFIERILRVIANVLDKQADKDRRALEDNTKAMEVLRAENSKIITHKTRCNVLSKRVRSLTD